MMNAMSFSETIFLFFLALIIFGPKKLPEIARQVGKALNDFKRASNEFKSQIEQEIANLEVEKRTILPPSTTPEGTASRGLISAPVETSVVSETTVPASDAPVSASESPVPEAVEKPVAEVLPPADELATSDPLTSTTSQESHA